MPAAFTPEDVYAALRESSMDVPMKQTLFNAFLIMGYLNKQLPIEAVAKYRGSPINDAVLWLRTFRLNVPTYYSPSVMAMVNDLIANVPIRPEDVADYASFRRFIDTKVLNKPEE